jgi:prolyl-tRNA synthetase
MQNGLALQAGTSHDLGQNFGKAFDVKFQSSQGALEYVWQTSWGASTRLIGGLIMSHSDDRGLVLPPKVAPRRAVLVPIYRKDEERSRVLETASRLAADLAGIPIDSREALSPGAKFFHWERRGIPVVFELGPRDLANGMIVLKRRDTGTKETIAQTGAPAALASTLDAMQGDLYQSAAQRLRENTVLANSLDEVESILADVTAEKGGGKFVMAHLKDDPASDARIKALKASVRNIPLVDNFDGPGPCILSGEQVPQRVVIAKAY